MTTTSWPRLDSAHAADRPSRPPPTTANSVCIACYRGRGLPAAGPPLRDLRALGAERGVAAVPRVDPGAVWQFGEDAFFEVGHQRVEPDRVLLCVARAAWEQRVAGEQMRLIGQFPVRVVEQGDAARCVATQV